MKWKTTWHCEKAVAARLCYFAAGAGEPDWVGKVLQQVGADYQVRSVANESFLKAGVENVADFVNSTICLYVAVNDTAPRSRDWLKDFVVYKWLRIFAKRGGGRSHVEADGASA